MRGPRMTMTRPTACLWSAVVVLMGGGALLCLPTSTSLILQRNSRPAVRSLTNPRRDQERLFNATESNVTNSSSPVPNLPFGDVNVLVLTDVHSWIGGHGDKEPYWNVDYGHVLSFYQKLKEYCQHQDRDLWFVVNGDWIDGTGLATDGDPSHLIPLLEKMPWDALNIGNHELYRAEVIDYIIKPGGFVDWWGHKYLSSNIMLTDTQNPLGFTSRLLQGRHGNVLVFGFLYNMEDNSHVVTVKKVESVVQESWFKEALHPADSTLDAILVLAHMDVQNPLVDVILAKIRQELGPDMPVQFITGHTHYRGFHNPDNNSASFEAGRYLDTLGFVSFPTIATVKSQSSGNMTTTGSIQTNQTAVISNLTEESINPFFKFVYMDANIDVLKKALGGVVSFDTTDGIELSDYIQRTRQQMGLTKLVGCINQTYFLEKGLDDGQSLWGFFRDSVVPSLFQGATVLFFNKGNFRYDLINGTVHIDDLVGVSPFNESLFYWDDIPINILATLNSSLNAENEEYMSMLPEFIMAPSRVIAANETFRLITAEFTLNQVAKALTQIYPNSSAATLLTNHTTTSLWINYFQRNSSSSSCSLSELEGQNTPHGSQAKDPSREKDHHHKPHHIPFHVPSLGKGNKTQTSSSSSPSLTDNAAADKRQLVFVACACLVMLLLGFVNIRQRGRRHHAAVSTQEHMTAAAWREYEEEDRFV